MIQKSQRPKILIIALVVIGAVVVGILSQTAFAPKENLGSRAGEVGLADRDGASDVDLPRLGGSSSGVEGSPQAGPAPSRTSAAPEAFGVTRKARCDGTIRDQNGAPIAGVMVIVFEPALYGPGGKIIAEAVTDADGNYAMDVALGDELRIAASEDGYLGTRERLARGPMKGRDFVLRSTE